MKRVILMIVAIVTILAASLPGMSIQQAQAEERVDSQPMPASESISIPLYGNWCGPNHGSGNAIDALDNACYYHDTHGGSHPYFEGMSCAVEVEFFRRVSNAGNPYPIFSDQWFAFGSAKGTILNLWAFPLLTAGCL